MKKKKLILWIIVLIFVLAIVYAIFKSDDNGDERIKRKDEVGLPQIDVNDDYLIDVADHLINPDIQKYEIVTEDDRYLINIIDIASEDIVDTYYIYKEDGKMINSKDVDINHDTVNE